MKRYAAQLEALQSAMLGSAPQVVLPFVNPARADMFSPAARVAVYVGGYQERLKDVVAADYPALQHAMGSTSFDDTVKRFVQAHPSRHWDLNRYSWTLPDWMQTQGMDKAHVSVAMLEMAISRAFWLADSKALTLEALAIHTDEALSCRHFRLRASLHLLGFDVAANGFVTDFRAGKNPHTIVKKQEFVAVLRHDHEVHRHVLDSAEYALLSCIAGGMAFGAAVEKTSQIPEHEATLQAQIGTYLPRWIANGFFTA